VNCVCGGPVVDGACQDLADAEKAHGFSDETVDCAMAQPVPMLAGTFAIYEDGAGGFVLVTETTEHGVQRKVIPAALVKMATGGGMLGRRFAGLFGGG
jgi:hypothetical protein